MFDTTKRMMEDEDFQKELMFYDAQIDKGNSWATSPFLLTSTFSPPTSTQCITDYSTARALLVPPFRCSVKGTVVDVQDTDFSSSGHPTQLFDIVDDTGSWIRCCAVGRNASARALVEGNIVVMYFCVGRSFSRGLGGMLFLMRDAILVKVGQQARRILKRLETKLK